MKYLLREIGYISVISKHYWGKLRHSAFMIPSDTKLFALINKALIGNLQMVVIGKILEVIQALKYLCTLFDIISRWTVHIN